MRNTGCAFCSSAFAASVSHPVGVALRALKGLKGRKWRGVKEKYGKRVGFERVTAAQIRPLSPTRAVASPPKWQCRSDSWRTDVAVRPSMWSIWRKSIAAKSHTVLEADSGFPPIFPLFFIFIFYLAVFLFFSFPVVERFYFCFFG